MVPSLLSLPLFPFIRHYLRIEPAVFCKTSLKVKFLITEPIYFLRKWRVLWFQSLQVTLTSRSGRFDLVLYFGVAAPVIALVISILKLVVFGELVLICWRAWSLRIWLGSPLSLRQFNRVSQGWSVWDSVKRLLQREASRWSVSAHEGFGCLSERTTRNKYLKDWDIVLEFQMYRLWRG